MGIKSLSLPEILLYIYCTSLVKHTTAHCSSLAGRKFAPGEGGRNVTLTVNCSQENAVLTWSNGGIPYLQEVTIYSSCINPTNTSEGAVTHYLYWAFFGVSSELDAKQVTVEAFPGRRCSYYGCYERQARARYYTFSTVSCVWTELAALNLVPSGTHQPPTIPSQQTSSSSYLAQRSTNRQTSALLTSSFSSSPTPAVISYTFMSSEGVSDSTPMYVWVVPVVLMVLLIITVVALILTCYIAVYKHGHRHTKMYLLLWMPFGSQHSTT